jgi:hypothetical protein
MLRPLVRARRLSLSIEAALRASSCARSSSSIEADDKLPTPVFQKFGSGLYVRGAVERVDKKRLHV